MRGERDLTTGPMARVVKTLVLALLVIAVSDASEDSCGNRDAPAYVRLECTIVSQGAGCWRQDVECRPGQGVNMCDMSRGCQAWTGIELHVTCRVGTTGGESAADQLELFRNGERLGSHTTSYPFATALASDTYECRWLNGSFFANRSVAIDDRVFVVPGVKPSADPRLLVDGDSCPDTSFEQTCTYGIVDDFNCSVAHSRKIYPYARGKTHSVFFNVLGARPISLSVEVVLGNHYPVDLNLSFRSGMALNSTSHNVNLTFDNLALVGQKSVETYLVVTGASANHSSSMCVHITVTGEPVLFPNESLPEDLSVTEGQPAEFNCDPKTSEDKSATFTVAYLVSTPSHSNLTECFNATFSKTYPLNLHSHKSNGSCSGLEVLNSTSGHSLDLTYHLTARWPSPTPSLSGAEVVCAIASRGITQWAKTATLSVLSASASPSLGTSLPPSSPPQLAALASITLLLLVGGVSLLALLLWWRRRQQLAAKTQAAKTRQQLELTPLALASLPSSGCTTPTLPAPHFPHFPNTRLLQTVQAYSDSLDSGLDLGDIEGSKAVHSGNRLRVIAGCHSSSLTDLFFSPSREVCVYVSYCDSQAEWVRETLLLLLHSFQPITVTDHEGHMIAGSIISEERLRLLRSADKVVAVVSPDYQLSEWCCYELQHVIQQSPAGAGHLIPLLCGGCRELPSTIATLHPLSLEDPNWHHKLKVAIRRQHHHSS